MKAKKRYTDTKSADVFGGRTIDEQLSYVDKLGNHGLPEIIKAMSYYGTAKAMAKETAENLVFLGCYHPFLSHERTVAYFELLDALGVEFACLDKEYCCGAFPIKLAKDDKESVMKRSREFVKRNIEAADLKKAKRIAYFCCQCAYVSRFLVPEAGDRLVYGLDIILEALKGRSLKLPPARAGYFEGCHTNKIGFPEIDMNWKAYRETLNKVKGLSVEDIPNNVCCQTAPDKILEMARQKNLETLICPCSTCAMGLNRAIGGHIKIITLAEVLLDACNESA